MRRLITTATLILLLAGWGPCTRVVRSDPVQAQCDAMCYAVDKDAPENSSCASRARWDGDPGDPGAWNQLTQGTVPELRGETWQCGVRLKACQQCLDRLQKAGVIAKP